MGKRSTGFERRPRDFYSTPPKAVAPLLPHLVPNTRFAEPCAGDGQLIDYLVNRARSFVFSTAPVPAAAAAAGAALGILRSTRGKDLCDTLWSRTRQLAAIIPNHGPEATAPILPWIVGDEAEAVTVADALREKSFLVPAIRYPTVARGTARLRFTASAAHTTSDIDSLEAAIRQIANSNE